MPSIKAIGPLRLRMLRYLVNLSLKLIPPQVYTGGVEDTYSEDDLTDVAHHLNLAMCFLTNKWRTYYL